MIGERWLRIPVTVSLGVVGGVLLIALLASLLHSAKEKNVRFILLKHQFHRRNTTSSFRRLLRPDNRMLRGVEMSCGVFVLGGVTAATWPQLKHRRRCTQLSPIFRHSSQPLVFGFTRLI